MTDDAARATGDPVLDPVDPVEGIAGERVGDPPVAPRRHWRDDLRLLRHRDLSLLVWSRFISVLGSGIAPIALAFGVLDIPGGDATALGLVLLCAAVPRALFMLVGGVLADRVRRSRLMVVSELMAGAAHLVAGALFFTGHATVPWLCVLAAIGGTATALFFPAFTGVVPEVAEDHELQSANALLRLATNVGSILGTALGGVLVATIGSGPALVLDGLTFVVSAALLLLVRTKRSMPPSGESLLRDLRDGWREFVSRRWVVVIVVTAAIANVGNNSALGVLGPVQAKAVLGGAGPWALIFAAFGVGALAGVVVALRIRPQRPMLVAILVSPVFSLPIAALALGLPAWVIAVFAFFAGVAGDVFGVLWDTALQQHVPDEALSRVSSYDWFGSLALVPIGLALAGPLAAAIGVEGALWVAFGLSLLLTLPLLDPQVRGLRAGRPEDAPGAGR